MIITALKQAAISPALAGVFVRSVRLAATYDHRHPLIMTITWSWPELGEIERPGPAGVVETIRSRPADTLIQIERTRPTVRGIEASFLEDAWLLGAWDVRRTEHAPLADPERWREMRYGLAVDFGHNNISISGSPLQIGDRAPESTLRHAAVEGWVTWTMIPQSLTTPTMRRLWIGKDRTLNSDGRRSTPIPVFHCAEWAHPQPGYAHDHIYQLGRAPSKKEVSA